MTSIQKIIEFRQKLIDQATGRGEIDVQSFTAARQSIIDDQMLREFVPELIRKNRTPQDFWDYIKSKHADYAGRRNEIRLAFDPLLERLELGSSNELKTLNPAKAFISYSTTDKASAGLIKTLLKNYEIESFMAHDDIEVSQEWRVRILNEIRSCGIFVCLLSENFLDSHFCIQETGIASSMPNVCVIPLSLDGTIPPGFLNNFQSAKINPEEPLIDDLLPAFLERKPSLGIDIAISSLTGFWGYRTAEARTSRLVPYLDRMTKDQASRLISCCRKNDQIYDAGLCATEFLPMLISKFKELMDPESIAFFQRQIERYKL